MFAPEDSPLAKQRHAYPVRAPGILKSRDTMIVSGEAALPSSDREALSRLFPRTYGSRVATLTRGESPAPAPLRVGVVLSGGQAPGGHNVICGILDAITAFHPGSRLFGFLKGPGGVIKGRSRELTAVDVDPYRNTGGFDLILSGRDKIETRADLDACAASLSALGLDGLVIIGGDDSNTNAAVLAEHLLQEGVATRVIGVPKTIDGDMKNEQIETSFGFDSSAKTYSELIGKICRDAASAVKYWHFVRLMGRAASHVTLECALQTRPNVALISEEMEAKKVTFDAVVEMVSDAVLRRVEIGRNYGVILVPEGLIEFLPDVKALIGELKPFLKAERDFLRQLPDHEARAQHVVLHLSQEAAGLYGSLPRDVQAVLLRPDKHFNIALSQIETERLLADRVAARLKAIGRNRGADVPFAAITHFLGYEGRCAMTSNFDADYSYSLGLTAAHLVRAGLTGYTAHIRGLAGPVAAWVPGGTPVTSMLTLEDRGQGPIPVIRKALVDLGGRPFRTFAEQRDRWAIEDAYRFPGPIQYFGPPEVCDQPTMTLMLECGGLEGVA